MAPGMKKVQRQAEKDGEPLCLKPASIAGMTIAVAPPPMLPLRLQGIKQEFSDRFFQLPVISGCQFKIPRYGKIFGNSPASSDCISSANNSHAEKRANPVLTADEAAKRQADEQTDCLKTASVDDHGDEEDGRGKQ